MGYAMCDWIDNALALQMGRSEGQIYGYIHLPCRVEVNARVRGESREAASRPARQSATEAAPNPLLEKPIV